MKSTGNSQVLPLIDEAATWKRKKKTSIFEHMLVPLMRKPVLFFDVTDFFCSKKNGSQVLPSDLFGGFK